jgi:cytochrome c oxidase subunit 2
VKNATSQPARLARLALAASASLTLALGAAACGSGADEAGTGGDGAPTDAQTDAPAAGSAAANGEQLLRSSGCAGCHGADFRGGAGPSLVGLAGSTVTLADGTTMVADTAYLTRAIANPSADLVDGYNLRMPANGLTDAEIADIVAYIETLADG